MRPVTPSSVKRYRIPSRLLQPLWFRSQESLADNGLVYDPIAAAACKHCHLAPDCLNGDVAQKQLLHATLTQLCDQQVRAFLESHPNAWIINVGAGLDTRFYRVDNGLCHWLELDVTENLLWRQKLFHRSERYQHVCGSVENLEWLDTLAVPDFAPVLILCDCALLDCDTQAITRFIRALGLGFTHASACIVLAGDRASSHLGQKLGSGAYAHGFRYPENAVRNGLPWITWSQTLSPLNTCCNRWKFWQRCLNTLGVLKQRYTPVLVHVRW